MAEFQFRAGGRVLSLFSTALHGSILRALANGPMRLSELRKEIGGSPQTTLRGHLGNLIGLGALEKRNRNGQSNMVDNALTPVGLEMLFVADVLEDWLARAPEEPLELNGEAGKTAIKALIGGWSSTMLRALAARPFTLTELDNLITSFSYPSLERRLSAMHLARQVAAKRGNGRGTPYAVTDWLREGAAPLLVAARCERRHMASETAPLTRIDVEAILLLALPLVSLPKSFSGGCQLAVENGDEGKWRAAGASVVIEEGKVAACSSKLDSNPATVARGPVAGWFDAIAEGNVDQLRVSGGNDLAIALLDGLHGSLFSPSRGDPSP